MTSVFLYKRSVKFCPPCFVCFVLQRSGAREIKNLKAFFVKIALIEAKENHVILEFPKNNDEEIKKEIKKILKKGLNIYFPLVSGMFRRTCVLPRKALI